MKRTHLIPALVGVVAMSIFAAEASAMYNPGTGGFMQRDPGAGGMMGAPRVGSAGPATGGQFAPRDQYADGMNLYQYVQSRPVVCLDPYGLVAHTYKVWDGASFPTNAAQDAEIAASRVSYNTKKAEWHYFMKNDDPWVVIGSIQGAASITAAGAAYLGTYPNAVKALTHFLENTGAPFFMDYPMMLSQDRPALDHANESLRAAQTFVEDNFPSISAGKKTIVATDWIGITEVSHPDWAVAVGQYYTLGGAFNGECKAGKYSMEWQIDLQDMYDWNENDWAKKFPVLVSPAELHLLHVYGRAREFMQYGSYEKTITWKQGERAPLTVP